MIQCPILPYFCIIFMIFLVEAAWNAQVWICMDGPPLREVDKKYYFKKKWKIIWKRKKQKKKKIKQKSKHIKSENGGKKKPAGVVAEQRSENPDTQKNHTALRTRIHVHSCLAIIVWVCEKTATLISNEVQVSEKTGRKKQRTVSRYKLNQGLRSKQIIVSPLLHRFIDYLWEISSFKKTTAWGTDWCCGLWTWYNQ